MSNFIKSTKPLSDDIDTNSSAIISLSPGTWQTLSPINGWSCQNSYIEYRSLPAIDSVQFRFAYMKNGTNGVVGQLPSGFRPVGSETWYGLVSAWDSGSGTQKTDLLMITPSGNITIPNYALNPTLQWHTGLIFPLTMRM